MSLFKRKGATNPNTKLLVDVNEVANELITHAESQFDTLKNTPELKELYPGTEANKKSFKKLFKDVKNMSDWEKFTFFQLLINFGEFVKQDLFHNLAKQQGVSYYNIDPQMAAQPTKKQTQRKPNDFDVNERDGVGGVATKTKPNNENNEFHMGDTTYYRNELTGLDPDVVDATESSVNDSRASVLYRAPLIMEFLSNGNVVLNRQFTEQLHEDQQARYGLTYIEDSVRHIEAVMVYVGMIGDKVFLRTYVPSLPFQPLHFTIDGSAKDMRFSELTRSEETYVLRDYFGVEMNAHKKFIFRPEYMDSGVVTYIGIEYDEESPHPFKKDPLMNKFVRLDKVAKLK